MARVVGGTRAEEKCSDGRDGCQRERMNAHSLNNAIVTWDCCEEWEVQSEVQTHKTQMELNSLVKKLG